MPPTTTVKKSVRFEPEAIAILEAYAAAHSCTQTDAINAIILASDRTHTHLVATQLPPTVATQDNQWQRSIEVRLAKLEAATQLPPTVATHSDSPKFERGQAITGQQAKTYNLLEASVEARQTLGKAKYMLNNKLGVIFKNDGSVSRSGKPIFEIWLTFPGDKVIINEDGTFLKDNGDSNISYLLESEIAAKEALEAIAEPMADVEPVDNEIAIETVEMPCSSTVEGVMIEPEQPSTKPLTGVEFREKLGFVGMELGATPYTKVCTAGKSAKGWTAPNSDVWFAQGKGKDILWTMVAVAALAAV